jgi:hypothetical protein
MSSVRPSVCLSVRYFSAGMPIELKCWTNVGVCVSIVRSRILDPWPRSPGINQDPLLRKYAFLSITFFEQNWTCEGSFDKSQYQEWIGPIVNCACGLLPNAAKVPNFQYRAWYALWIRNFIVDDEKTQEPRFWDFTAINWPKCPNSKIRHDGILSIGNFMQIIILHVFSCPVS